MDIKKQQRAVVDALEDIKAQDIQVFNTEGITSLFDRVVIATATSNRQTRALANSVQDKARELGINVIATEGQETGEWVLVDLGDIVIHIMQPAIRQYYNLEEIWGGKPVRVKLGGSTAGAATEKATTKAATKKAPVKKAAKSASKSAAAKSTTKKTTKKAATKTAKKAPQKRATKKVAQSRGA